MLKIASFKCENSKNHIVTDSLNPSFSFYVESDNKDVFIKEAYITINNWKKKIDNPLNIVYEGEPLIPFTKYEAKLDIVDNYNNKDSKTITFETGFLNESWSAKWISDKSYVFKEKKISPKVMVFKKDLSLQKKVKSAKGRDGSEYFKRSVVIL
jgi:alpha-L-rhamnosidase